MMRLFPKAKDLVQQVFSKAKEIIQKVLDTSGVFYGFYVYFFPTALLGVNPTSLVSFLPTKAAVLWSREGLVNATIGQDINVKKIDGYYQALKRIVDNGGYISARIRSDLLDHTSSYTSLFRQTRSMALPRHEDLFDMVVDSLLHPHAQQAKEHIAETQNLCLRVMVTALILGRTEQLDLVMKKYSQMATPGFYHGVAVDLECSLSKTHSVVVLERMLRYPVLVNDPKLRGSFFKVFETSPAGLAILRAQGILEPRPNGLPADLKGAQEFKKHLLENHQAALSVLIRKAYAGPENLQPLKEIFNLLCKVKGPGFTQGDYDVFFKNQLRKASPAERTYPINLVLQQFLGKLKSALPSHTIETAAYTGLEDALRSISVDTLAGLINPILGLKEAMVPVVVARSQEKVAEPAGLRHRVGHKVAFN